jgi:diguanylate cyclase (GGDEF)-like protein
MGAATLVGEAHFRAFPARRSDGPLHHTYFYQQIDLEVRRYVRYGTVVSLVLIDIDDFKVVNDTYGHREGDRILAAMAGNLKRVARDSDICCRYGGEEFAVILPMTDLPEAGLIAERLKWSWRNACPGTGR